MDTFSKKKRSEIMSRIRSKNSNCELILRKYLFSIGYRYRIHSKKLPGQPDLVFSSRKKVIFIHGCFWHQHEDCNRAIMPKSNKDYWYPKLENNKERGAANIRLLKEQGWSVLSVWECELIIKSRLETTKRKVVQFLGK